MFSKGSFFLANLLLGSLILLLVLFIAVYIYLGFAFSAIGRKAKLKTPNLAWIPFVGPLIIAFQISKMHWWPWLLLIGIIIPIVNILVLLAFTVFATIWQWKMFVAIGKPGWWALIDLGGFIPFIGVLFTIAQLVLYGIAAWSKQ
ncbi:MAG: hypothetical protein QW273_02940 [Candidatus Pacearchaeota archaeon]